MVDIGAIQQSIASGSYRIDRQAYVERSVSASQTAAAAGVISKAITADELNQQLDSLETDIVKASDAAASVAGGQLKIISAAKDNGDGSYAVLTGEAAAIYRGQQTSSSSGRPLSAAAGEFASFTALNVDSVLKFGAGEKSSAHYADYVRSEVESLSSSHSQFVFTGAIGKSCVTHDVDEYINWLNTAASKRAATVAKALE